MMTHKQSNHFTRNQATPLIVVYHNSNNRQTAICQGTKTCKKFSTQVIQSQGNSNALKVSALKCIIYGQYITHYITHNTYYENSKFVLGLFV